MKSCPLRYHARADFCGPGRLALKVHVEAVRGKKPKAKACEALCKMCTSCRYWLFCLVFGGLFVACAAPKPEGGDIDQIRGQTRIAEIGEQPT